MIDYVQTGPGSDCRDNGQTINKLVDAVNQVYPVTSSTALITVRTGPSGLVIDDTALVDVLRRAGISI